jgi:uncharacterized protein (DUF433 family)
LHFRERTDNVDYGERLMAARYELIGVGLYSIGEVARFTGVPATTVNRWVRGYARRRHGQRTEYPPLMPSSLQSIDDKIALSFRDLMEIRFVAKLRALGVSWSEIDRTVATAREILKTHYPFGSLVFKSDGARVFAELEKGGRLLRDGQFAFGVVFAPSLFAELEYEAGQVVRWRPSSGSNVVVLDPRRSFGKPLLDAFDVQTRVVAAAVEAEGSAARVADWYEIPLQAVRTAVTYERQLLAA